jgi:NAD(P)-dependent dehydrogenase (short-subunit alcohol dehydrogenase family)
MGDVVGAKAENCCVRKLILQGVVTTALAGCMLIPVKIPGQPAGLATAYVMLADPLSSYVSGATIAVTGGRPIL